MHNRTAATVAAACWTTGAVAYLLAEAVTALRYPGYSYAHRAISDLGTPDSPAAALMNAAFCLQGAMFLLGAVFAGQARAVRPARAWPLLTFAVANAVGNVLVATVHSGAGPLHMVGAVLAIVGGNAAALAGAGLLRPAAVRWASVVLGATGLLSAALLTVVHWLPAAVFERVSVYTIIGWQLLAAVSLLTPARRERPERPERDGGRG